MFAGGVLEATANVAAFGIECSLSWNSLSFGLLMLSMCQHKHLELNRDLLHHNCSETPVLTVDLFEDFESQSFGCQSLPQDLWWDSVTQLVLSTARKSQCNSRTSCWPSDVLDSLDSRFFQFLNNGASKFALSSLWSRTSRSSSSSRLPKDDWASRDSSNISRYCCVSWTKSVKCWRSPAWSWLRCCVTSSAFSAWRLRSVRKSCTYSSRLHTSDVTSVTKFSRWSWRAWFASWEDRAYSSLCLCENHASASCSRCRSCICTLQLCTSIFLAKALTRF